MVTGHINANKASYRSHCQRRPACAQALRLKWLREIAMQIDISKVIVAMILAGAATPALADGDAAKGKMVFTRCASCHTLTDQNRLGPHLSGVLGRKAGSVPGFRYSKAMLAFGKTWDEQTLDAYLAAPLKVVPGTSMAINLSNAQDRADVIAYLKTVPAP
jgi:cytochrome c